MRMVSKMVVRAPVSVPVPQPVERTFVERIAMLVDGANMYTACKAINLDLDYGRLLDVIKKKGQLVRAAYFTAVIDDREQTSSLKKLVDWLDYNGYSVVTKPTKTFTDSVTGHRKMKGNMDVELVIEAIRIASKIDRLYLFSGDGDFKALVEYLQHNGVSVTVISAKVIRNPALEHQIQTVIADELRRQANEFIDLETLRTQVCRLREAQE